MLSRPACRYLNRQSRPPLGVMSKVQPPPIPQLVRLSPRFRSANPRLVQLQHLRVRSLRVARRTRTCTRRRATLSTDSLGRPDAETPEIPVLLRCVGIYWNGVGREFGAG